MTIKGFVDIILFRWLRVGAPLFILTASEFVWPLFGDGPLFTEMTSYIDVNCRKNWWKNILLISNYDKPTEICLIHAWYLSAEFQLFVLGVIALVVLNLHDKLGKFLCFVLMLTGMVIPAYKSYFLGSDPAFLASHGTFNPVLEYLTDMYLPMYCHLTPFFIGLLVAYMLDNNQMLLQNVKKNCKTAFLFYCGFWSVFYFPGIWNSFAFPVDPVTAGLYSLLHRFIWTLGFLSVVLFSKDLYFWFVGLFEKRKKTSTRMKDDNDNQVPNQVDFNEKKDKTSILGKAIAFSRLSFKTASKLYFSLYLVHSIFIRYDWFTARSPQTFNVFSNVSVTPFLQVVDIY